MTSILKEGLSMCARVMETKAISDPVGELIDLGGYRLHLHSQGTGGPAVIMEAAIWDIGLTWSLVQPEVAQFTRAVVYDRGGLGWSDPSPKPRTAAVMVEELHALLQRAGIAGPYVLVGQSFSGLLVRLFAYTYPDEMAGLVLVDAAHEDQDSRYPEAIRNMAQPMFDAQLQLLQQRRAMAVAEGPLPSLLPGPAQLPGDIAEKYQALITENTTRLDTMIAELSALQESRSQLRSARDRGLGDIPVIVLSHGIPQSVPGLPDEVNRDYEAAWQQLQIELATQSTHGTRIVAEGAGHMIHHDRPDQVVAAIQQIVTAARKR
jgi:pimeloyl-ACP methyl ester carboxylesterase